MPVTTLSRLLLITLACLMGGCQQSKPADSDGPDAVRDLRIDRIRWQPRTVVSQAGVPLNEHQFSVTNASTQYNYRQIRIRFDYYDAYHRRVDTKRYTIPESVEARSALAIQPVLVGKVHPLTQSTTVRVEQALTDQH